MQLCQIDSTLKYKANFVIISYEQLFAEMSNKILNVKLLERMSKDFAWNFQRVLVHQVI